MSNYAIITIVVIVLIIAIVFVMYRRQKVEAERAQQERLAALSTLRSTNPSLFEQILNSEFGKSFAKTLPFLI